MAATMIALILSVVLSGASGFSGTVVDIRGGVVPGVNVVVLDAKHQPTAEKAVTGINGEFAFPNAALPVEIEVSLAGFNTQRVVVRQSPVRILITVKTIVETATVYAQPSTPGWRDAA